MPCINNSYNKQKAIWKVINSENGRAAHKGVPSSVTTEKFSEYFASIGEEIINSIAPNSNEPMHYVQKLNTDTTKSCFLNSTNADECE